MERIEASSENSSVYGEESREGVVLKRFLKKYPPVWKSIKAIYWQAWKLSSNIYLNYIFRLLHLKEWRAVNRLRCQFREIQLSTEEIVLIHKAITKHPKCRLLVFGLGNDTPLWMEVNREGETVFLEDNDKWFEQITKLYPQVKAYRVNYPTQRNQWHNLLNRTEDLIMQLPAEVAHRKWDVILVDAPAGYSDITPGRMQSIYTASRLIDKGGHIFVDDCYRKVEQVYSDKYLRKQNRIPHILFNGKLRVYVMKDGLNL